MQIIQRGDTQVTDDTITPASVGSITAGRNTNGYTRQRETICPIRNGGTGSFVPSPCGVGADEIGA